jgi:hypothetical protein
MQQFEKTQQDPLLLFRKFPRACVDLIPHGVIKGEMYVGLQIVAGAPVVRFGQCTAALQQ